jgi:hypothetical protein
VSEGGRGGERERNGITIIVLNKGLRSGEMSSQTCGLFETEEGFNQSYVSSPVTV